MIGIRHGIRHGGNTFLLSRCRAKTGYAHMHSLVVHWLCRVALQDLSPFKLLCGGFGRAKVLGMDAITFPPLLLTISADRVVSL